MFNVLFSLILFPGETLSEEVELQLPENVVMGSARASVSVLGNHILILCHLRILGRTVNGYTICLFPVYVLELVKAMRIRIPKISFI